MPLSTLCVLGRGCVLRKNRASLGAQEPAARSVEGRGDVGRPSGPHVEARSIVRADAALVSTVRSRAPSRACWEVVSSREEV